MKRFTKICLLASLFLIIMGGTMCIIGTAIGGWRVARDVVENGNSWVRLAWSVPANYGWYHTGIWEDLEDIREPERLEGTETETVDTDSETGYVAEDGTYRELHHTSDNGSVPQDYEDTGIRASDVRELDIEIGGARLYLLETESDSFGIRTEGQGDYRSYEKNGTFYLEGDMDDTEFWEEFSGLDQERVYLYLPKGLVLKEAEIEVGGGLIEIAALSADKIALAVGAGKVSAEVLGCDSLDVEVGAGEVSLYQVTAQKAGVEIGMGKVFLLGDVSGEVKVDCDMGSAELILSGEETDYNYEIDCDMGSIEVGGRSYSSLASTSKINNGAAGKCSLECSMGKISVAFTEGQ